MSVKNKGWTELSPDQRQKRAAGAYKQGCLRMLEEVITKLTGYETRCDYGIEGALVMIDIYDVPKDELMDATHQVYQLERDLFDGFARGRFSVAAHMPEEDEE